MISTKLCLLLGAIAAHPDPNPSFAGLVARSAKNIVMSPIRSSSRRLTRKTLLKTIIASSVFICLFIISVCGSAFYSVAQVHRPHHRLLARHPRDVLPSGMAEKVLRVFRLDSSVSKSKIVYKTSTTGFHRGDPVWDMDHMVGRYLEQPKCNEQATLLMLVTSSRENFQKRQVLRDTWCSNQGSTSYDTQCVFLIGQGSSQNDPVVKNLTREIHQYNDVLLADYQDSYKNLTYKVLSGFLWSTKHCSTPYVLKTDDDCFVNRGLFQRILKAKGSNTGIYLGRIFHSEEERQVIRDPRSKWAVPESQFANDFYPPYASGVGYLLSGDVVKSLVELSQFLLPFPNEDAYVGVLVDRLGVTPIDSGRFTFYNVHWAVCNLLYILVVHQVGALRQREFLSQSLEAQNSCESSMFKTTWT